MIRKAVFSYFNTDESFLNRCGFAKYSDFLFTTALAIVCASKHFPEVQIVSSSWGIDVFKELNLPITEYSNKLDKMRGVSRFFWAYGKLIAYCEQKKPFVHLDNDVFLWSPLPERILNAHLCFQSKEPFDLPGYNLYLKLKPCFEKAPIKPKTIAKNPVDDYAYNCGICGGNNLKIFKEWKKCSEEYIFAEENEKVFFKEFPELLIHQNLFHEQYFLACLIKKHKWRDKIELLNDDAMGINKDLDPNEITFQSDDVFRVKGDPTLWAQGVKGSKYSHIWGATKTNDALMMKIRMSLFYLKKSVFDSVNNFCIRNKI